MEGTAKLATIPASETSGRAGTGAAVLVLGQGHSRRRGSIHQRSRCPETEAEAGGPRSEREGFGQDTVVGAVVRRRVIP